MSLVNQMLQDLEQRRTAEGRTSPLGGLSASGVAVSKTQSMNYLLMGTTLLLALVVVFALIYLVDAQQSMLVAPVADMAKTPSVSSPVAPAVTQEVAPVVMRIATQTAPISSQKTTAKTQQPVERMKSPLVKESPVTNNKQGVAQANLVGTETELGESLNTTMMNDESENVGTMSIVESVSMNGDEVSQTVSINESPTTNDEAVNKTIRPLSNEQQAQIAFQQGIKLLGRGAEADAEVALKKALSLTPVHVRARETLAALFLNTGRVSEAADSLREGLRLLPKSAALAKLYARVLVNQGDNEAAVVVMERARPSTTEEVEYYALLAVLYREAGKHAQAIEIYEQMVKARPGVAAWWMGLALSQDAMGESEQALTGYQRAQRAGGLKPEVLQYVQARIDALTPGVAVTSSRVFTDDSDGLGD